MLCRIILTSLKANSRIRISLTDILKPESSLFHGHVGVERQRHVVRRGVDGNVQRPITEPRVGAVRTRSAELQPVVTALRFARWRFQFYVQ